MAKRGNMESAVLEWLLRQGPTVVIFGIIAWLLWTRLGAVLKHQEQLLDQCWQRILDCLDDDEP